MRVSIAGRHMEMTDALKTHVEERLRKVRAHFDRVIDADVVLSVEKHRHIAEITVHANGVSIHGKEATTDMYNSIDAVVEKLDKQIRKFKDRTNRHQVRKTLVDTTGRAAAEQGELLGEPAAEEPQASTPRPIVRETLSMKPLNVDEALHELELSGEDFIAFVNAGTQQLNVLHLRDDGDYGLIEPQF